MRLRPSRTLLSAGVAAATFAGAVAGATEAASAAPAGPRIHTIQGAAQQSPYAGRTVADVRGVVTAVTSKQLWMQDPNPDRDPATSEGIAVYLGSKPTATVGDAVSVSGTVKEYRPGSISSTNLTTTEIDKAVVTITGHGRPLPAATRVGLSGRVPPARIIDAGDRGNIETDGHLFDPQHNGIDFWESMEGMRVRLDDAQVVGPTNSYGETTVAPAGATVRSERGGLVARATDFNPERVVLAATLAKVPAANVGDSYPGALTGILDYDFGNFELLPTTSPGLRSGHLQRQRTRAPRAGELAVATFNVENLSPKDPQSKFDALADYATTNLAAPDILALEEIQDNDGPTNDGVVSADRTLRQLTDAIRAAGGPAYSWAQIDPTNDADGGQPGGNIRVAFLYRTDRGLQFVRRGAGDATTATSVQIGPGHRPQLSLSPGRIAPTDPAWKDSRKPLAGQFSFRGRPVFVIANHFDSKGGDDPLFGVQQPIREPSAVQRHAQATLVHDFATDIERIDRNASVLVLGDLNDFDFSTTAAILTAGQALRDLPATLPIAQRYTYVYQGNSEVLDHILLNPALARAGYSYAVVHLNSEFADQVSDHDPQIVRVRPTGR